MKSLTTWNDVELCGCMSYRHPTDGSSHCFQRCLAVCFCTPCVLGRLYSMIEKEENVLCGMGNMGVLMAVLLLITAPIPALSLVLTCFVARQIQERYVAKEVEESIIATILKSLCCAPCFILKMLNFMDITRTIKEEKRPGYLLPPGQQSPLETSHLV